MVLVGHSERRHLLGEADESVAKKLRAALEAGLRPVLCVGERLEEREEGRAEEVVERQILSALEGVKSEEASQVVVAYEPVWAIGTGRTARPEDAEAMHSSVRKRLGELFGPDRAQRMLVLYGGSVKPANASSLLGRPEIDGALVGGASLEVASFLAIAQAAGGGGS